jgi:hypothetical protein
MTDCCLLARAAASHLNSFFAIHPCNAANFIIFAAVRSMNSITGGIPGCDFEAIA